MVARQHWLSLLTLAALLVGPFALVPRAAEAQTPITYIVDTISDLDRPSGCTTPSSVDGDCSLRESIERANSDNVNSVIRFDESLSGQIMALADPGVPLPELSANNTTIDGVADPGGTQTQIAIYGGGSEFNGLTISGDNIVVIGLSLYGFVCSNFGAGAIVIEGGQSNRVERSYIGLTLDGLPPAANERNCNGVVIRGDASANRIQNANYIASNVFDGILIQDAIDNIIQGNFIGLQPGATQTASPNLRNGIHLLSQASQTTTGNLIGGTLSTERNFISGNGSNNTGSGILLSGPGTRLNTVRSNYIGLRSNGAEARPNNGDGVRIQAGARENSLLGSLASRLVISGNSGTSTSGNGIRITGSGTISNTVSGAIIGTNSAFTAAIANTGNGILIDNGASGNSVVGNATDRAIIAGNTGLGIAIRGAATRNNTVQGATVGLVPSGSTSVALANTGGGLLLADRTANTTLSGNTISGNGQFGVRVSEAITVSLSGNFIGLSLNQTGALANAGPGVAVYSSTNTLIGGATAGERNYIAGNGGPGVVITGTGTLSTTVDGNIIGLRRASAAAPYITAAPNGGEGVLVQDGPRQTRVGDTLGNIIGGAGAAATAESPAGVRVLSSPALPESEPITVTLTTIRNNAIGAIPNGILPVVDRGLGQGIVVEGAGVSQVDIVSNTVRYSAGDGVRISAAMTVTLGISNTIANNDGRGVFVNAGASDVTIISNTVSSNLGAAVRLEDAATRRVSIRNNELPANGGLVELAGSTRYEGEGEDVAAGPNHDIDPPFNIRVNQGGLIVGQVYTSTVLAEDALSPASACVSCTIQVFRYDSALPLTNADAWKLLSFDPDGGQVIVPDASGTFSAQLSEPLPSGQLLFAATDGYGNTSELVAFVPSAGLRIVPLTPASAAQSAAPGQTVTYTLRVENTGSLDLTGVRASTSGTLPRWLVNPDGEVDFDLPGLGSQVLTYTLTLPLGSDPSVRVPISDVTTVTLLANLPSTLDPDGTITDTQRLTTTVLAAARLRVAPARGTGSGRPNDVIPYEHTLYNEGNITITVNLESTTLDAADSQRVWDTELSLETVTLGPGESREIALSVIVPSTAQEGATATHFITATVVGAPDQTRVVSDTSTVTLSRRASMFSDENQDGLPAGKVTFTHTVLNLSNAPASFKLDYQANLGSTVQFFSDTPGVTIAGDGTFTISNVPGSNQLSLRAEVTVNERLLPGDTEVINIFLRDPTTGASIGGAAVVDRIVIRGDNGLLLPRLWLPMIFNNAAPQ